MNNQQRKARAAACFNEGRLEDARALYRDVCRIDTRDAESWYFLGVVAQQLNKPEEAEAAFRQACVVNPAVAGGHVMLGNVLFSQGKLKESEACFMKALELQPSNFTALNNLGSIAFQTGDTEEAKRLIERAISYRPDFQEAFVNLSRVLLELGELTQARVAAEQVLVLNRDSAEAHYYLGKVWERFDNPARAEQCFKAAIDLNPGFEGPCRQLVILYRQRGELELARELLEQALVSSPDVAGLHGDLSLVLLQLGEYARGWDEYRWRVELPDTVQRPATLPQWDGGSLREKAILVYAEQGIGDEIMFAGCLPDLVAAAGHVVVDCAERLVPLFSRSFPAATFHGGEQNTPPDWLSAHQGLEVQTLIGDLPVHYRRSEAAFPRHRGYLVPDPGAEQRWRDRYAGLGKGLKVGLSWRGGHPLYREQRSIPLEQWGKTLQAIAGARFISLQYGDHREEMKAFADRTGITLHDWEECDPLADLDTFAAQIHALDLVISVDNSTVHMAGALGRPVWILLPYSADWRWGMQQEDSAWYPSARLFRQRRAGCWSEVLEGVAQALGAFRQAS